MYTRIKKIRKEKGMKQIELAELLNTTQGNIARYERGDREPPLEMIIKIADIFNVTTDYILGRTDIMSNKKELTSAERKQALEIGEAALNNHEYPAVENNQEMMQAIEAVVRKVLAEQQHNVQ